MAYSASIWFFPFIERGHINGFNRKMPEHEGAMKRRKRLNETQLCINLWSRLRMDSEQYSI
jgi:hypothetical protein